MHIKPYLSYSQYSCFLISPNEYKKRYVDGIKLNNKYLDFGKLAHEQFEKEETEDSKELKVECNFYGIPLMGYLDGFNEVEKRIKEHKTGKTKWTQKTVDSSEQLTFYAIMASRQFNIKIDELTIILDWYPTLEDTDKTMMFTGEKYSFTTRRTLKDEIKIYPKIKKVWNGIDELINSLIE